MSLFGLNARAIDLVCDGQLDKAITEFRQALSLTLLQVAENQYPSVEATTQPLESNSVEFDALSIDESDINVCLDRYGASAFAVYSRVFVLRGDDAELNRASKKELKRVAIAILCNMALAHQLLVLKEASFEEQRLQLALRLYSKARCILDSYEREHAEIDHLLSLAVCNNMGCLYLQLFNLEEAQECIQDLEQQLESSCMSCFDDDVYSPFHLNMLLLSGSPVQNAPAA